jgi:hypothetical protein
MQFGEGGVLGGGKMSLAYISATIGDASAYLLVARRADLGAAVIAEQKSPFVSFVVNDDEIVRRDDCLIVSLTMLLTWASWVP